MNRMIGLMLVVFITGCGSTGLNSEGASSKPADTSFYQHWVHSYEEQNGKKVPNIFRPKGSKEFAPSRFRMQLAFDPNGQCNYMFLSPVDAHQMRDCVYTKIGNTVYLYDNGGASLTHLAFTIQSVNKGEMRMSYGVAKPAVKDAKKKAKPE